MRTALATRVDRLAKRIAPTTTAMSHVVFMVFDRDESDVVGVSALISGNRFSRHAGETVSQLLERACAATGFRVWAASYIDRWDGWSARADGENRNADGQSVWSGGPQ
jgi:hypothetical protein